MIDHLNDQVRLPWDWQLSRAKTKATVRNSRRFKRWEHRKYWTSRTLSFWRQAYIRHTKRLMRSNHLERMWPRVFVCNDVLSSSWRICGMRDTAMRRGKKARAARNNWPIRFCASGNKKAAQERMVQLAAETDDDVVWLLCFFFFEAALSLSASRYERTLTQSRSADGAKQQEGADGRKRPGGLHRFP